MYVCMNVVKKSSKPSPVRRALAEHFCCGNILLLLLKLKKLIQIFLVL